MNFIFKIIIMLASTSLFASYLAQKDSSELFFIKSHRVEVRINNGAAETTIKEVFINTSNVDKEGIFVLPLPKGATVSSFKMKMNGKWEKGKILEKNEARNIYNRIVSKMKDPGLIEYMGNEMFKASVYPIPKNGELETEIKYVQSIELSNNIFSYTYPLKDKSKLNKQRVYRYGKCFVDDVFYKNYYSKCRNRSRCLLPNYRRCVKEAYDKEKVFSIATTQDFTFSLKINSSVDIKSVYSPTHKIYVNKKDKSAIVGFEKNKAILNKDIKIFYTVSKKDIGASLLTYQEEKKDGYFMLMIAPKSQLEDKEIENKNIIMLVDTSGSMTGIKMKKSKEAINYVLNRLNSKDKFNIINFSTGVEFFNKVSVFANEENIKKAKKYVENIEAGGGTAIDFAMKKAIKSIDEELINTIIFITDGHPTVGETDKKIIVKNITSLNNAKNNAKIFSFGIGENLDAILLDMISSKNKGLSEFIKEGNIEEKISSFYNKIAYPVLRDIKLKFNNLEVYDIFPYNIPDVYRGQDIKIYGRYKKDNSFNIVKFFKKITLELSGIKKKSKKLFKYSVNLKSNENNNFIPSIWASKKIAFLLNSIRQNGENKELVDEIKKLSKKYGVVTPYTSYLVRERKNKQVRKKERILEQKVLIQNGRAKRIGYNKSHSMTKALNPKGSSTYFDSFDEEISEVAMSKKLNKMSQSDKIDSNVSKTILNKIFILKNSIWIDTSINNNNNNKVLKFKYMSDNYFKLLSKNTKLRKYLSVGKNVKLLYKGITIEVLENYSGKESNTSLIK